MHDSIASKIKDICNPQLNYARDINSDVEMSTHPEEDVKREEKEVNPYILPRS